MSTGYHNIFGEERLQPSLFQTGGLVSTVAADWVFGTTGGSFVGVLRRWTGAAWVKAKLKTYLSGTWQEKPLKVWTGTTWGLIDTTGV